MKILVTGGCGFIGSNLVDLLVQDKNNEVVVVDNLDTGKKENGNKLAHYIYADIREVFAPNCSEQHPLLSDVKIVYHLAALARIQPSFKNPQLTLDINAHGTGLVCEYATKIGAKVVYAGSSSFYAGVYLNPYAFSKWQGEEICKMYSKVCGLSAVVARFFNVYGPRHLCDGPYATVVGIFEKQFLSQQPLTVTGSGEQRRDFTHVNDICRGLVAMAQHEHQGEIFNLGTGKNHSINELASRFSGASIKYIPKRPGEAWITLADISKTLEKVDWGPKKQLEKYIKDFVDKNKAK